MTFRATFLGHQGWLLASSQTTWLIDPLLRDDFGDAHALGYQVYPPRIFDLSAFPEVDAVFLTHEHDDHFDIGSLAKIDRSIPIFLSARSSSAVRKILETMGFEVVRLEPGVVVEQGDLELVPFAGDHLGTSLGDEWDALPFSVRQKGTDAGFFSMVDVALTPRHVAWARAHARGTPPGIVTWTNNTIDLSHMDPALPAADATALSLRAMRDDHEKLSQAWGAPAVTLVCGGGFAFTGDRAWMNERVFTVDATGMCAELSRSHGEGRFVAAMPGQTFSMDDGQRVRSEDSAPFLRARPREEWPSRMPSRPGFIPDYEAATGRRDLPIDERRELAIALDAFAGTLVGGVTFRSLHSLLASELPARRLTFALVLRHGQSGERDVIEYDAPSCSFRPVTALHPESSYLAGLSCWGSDLLAVLRGDLGPIGVQLGRATLWNALPRRFRFDIFADLYRASHPLRQPAAFLRSYEKLWRQAASTKVVIRPHRA